MAGPHALHAQQLTPPAAAPQALNQAVGNKVSLIEVLKIALDNNPSIQTQAEVVSSYEGALQYQASAFDPSASASVAHTKSQTALFNSSAPTYADRDMSSSASVAKKFRNGVTVTPSVTLDSNRTNSQKWLGLGAENRATAALALNLPLLKGLGEAAVTSSEASARHTVEASQYDLRYQIASTVKDAADAYWTFRYAEDVLKARRGSETRAARLGEDMRKLIAADERPAADMNLTLANLAEKRVNRIIAEQSLLTARQSLGNTLGLELEDIRSLAGAADAFPSLVQEPKMIGDVRTLTDIARDTRWDLKAAAARVASAKALMIGAKDALQSDLDMDFSVGYSGMDEGAGPARAFGLNNTGFTIGATLSYDIPVGNNAARGTLRQYGAAQNQYEITYRALDRNIGTSVEEAVSAYNHAALQLLQAQTAVTLYEITVRNKTQELKLGQATLIDVITVEGQLQAAIINQLAQSANYASTITNLRFQTGHLIGEDQNISIEQFMTYDSPDEIKPLSKNGGADAKGTNQ